MPTTSDTNAHSPTAMIGSTQPRRQMFQMNSAAATIEMKIEQVERGQLRLHVGVARAVDRAAVEKLSSKRSR